MDVSLNTATRRLSILLVIAVVAGVSGLLVADIAAAQSVDRSGQNLVVELPETDERLDAVDVTVETVDGLSYTAAVSNGSDEAKIDVRNPAEGRVDGVSLTNETVSIAFRTADGVLNETITERVSLHTVAFESALPTWIADDTVRLPLNGSQTTGVDTNDSVTVEIADRQLTGTVLYGSEQLAVDRSALADIGSAEMSVDVRSETGSASVVAGTSQRIEPEIRSNDDGLVVWSPLFESTTDYDIEATDRAGESYRETSQPVAPGRIELPGLAPGEIEVTVSQGGATLLNRTGDEAVSFDGPLTFDAAVGGDGTTLEFDRSLAGLSVTGVAVDPEDGAARYTAIGEEIDENGQLTLDEPVRVDDQLLVSAGAGVAAVSLDSAAVESSGLITLPSEPLPVGLAFGAPLLIGVIVGSFGVLSNRKPTTGNKLVIGGLSLVLGLTSAAGVLEATVGLLPLSPTHVGGGGVGTLVGTAVAVGFYWQLGNDETVDPNAVYDARIELQGYDPSQGELALQRREHGSTGWDELTVHSNPHEIALRNRDTWEVRAVRGDKSSAVATISRQRPTARLTVPGQQTITITDPEGTPIANATVRIDADTGGTTDQNGTLTVTLPGDVTSVEAEISHAKYESKTATLQVDSGREPTVTLDPRTGELRIVTRVDGVQTGSVPVAVTPDEDALAELYATTEASTDAEGVFSESLMIGQYRVSSALPADSGAFRSDETTVTVREGTTVTAEIDLGFTGRLTAAHRERIEQLRADLRSLADSTGQDTAIQRYYGSVVGSMLETAESVPESGHAFIGTRTEPSVAVETILTMAAATTTAITDAMTTKRNVDLFAACSDMPATDVSWEGDCELTVLLGRLDQFESDPTTDRREVKQRYEAVSERIETERGEVAEISPVLEMHKQAWEMIDDTDRGTAAVGTRYGSLLLLDAVEAVFDHDPLRKRLSRTVF